MEALIEGNTMSFILKQEVDWRYWQLHPFINPSNEYIEKRAYYHYLNQDHHVQDDPIANWLLAEKEEIIAEIHRCQFISRIYHAEHDGRKEFTPFWTLYSPIVKLSKRYDFPKVSPRFNGERECTLCGETDKRKFRMESHLIPQNLGNNWFFSPEECDNCNKSYGRLYENELGSMLQVERAFGGVFKKGGGTVKSKYGQSQSYVGGQARGASLEIALVEGDPHIKHEQIDQHTEKFTFRAPAYKPLSAIKSLAKSVYLALPNQKRSKYNELKKWITDPLDNRPTSLYRIFVPGPGSGYVGMGLWEAKESNSEFPQLISLFQTSNYILIWPLPSLNENSVYATEVLPDLPLSRYYPWEPDVQREIWWDNIPITNRTISLEFKYYHKVTQSCE